jgi:hypothetical protein
MLLEFIVALSITSALKCWMKVSWGLSCYRVVYAGALFESAKVSIQNSPLPAWSCSDPSQVNRPTSLRNESVWKKFVTQRRKDLKTLLWRKKNIHFKLTVCVWSSRLQIPRAAQRVFSLVLPERLWDTTLNGNEILKGSEGGMYRQEF